MPRRTTLPRSLFWEVDVSTIDTARHRTYIIERVLEYGNEDSVRWLFANFPKEAITSVVKKSRRLSPKSRAYWGIKLGLWQSARQSARTPARIWKY